MKVMVIQDDSGAWEIRVIRESGLIEAIPIGRLSKEQAGREALRRGYSGAVMVDKEVAKAIREGKVNLIQ